MDTNPYKIIHENLIPSAPNFNECEEKINNISIGLADQHTSIQFTNPEQQHSINNQGLSYMPIVISFAPPDYNYQPNSNQAAIIIQQDPSLVSELGNQTSRCGHNLNQHKLETEDKENIQKSTSKESKNEEEIKSTTSLKDTAVNLAWRSYMAFVIVLLVLAALTLPFFCYTIARPLHHL